MVPEPPTPRPPRTDDDRRTHTAALRRDAQRLRLRSRKLAARHQALLLAYRQWLSCHPRPPVDAPPPIC
ncbi:MAG TPA: hypothetical protein VFN57_07895 [Thermomicrobiaceae bacterium]|nr:hypothetical protein [Thermomicrobiaceae bacterium]